MAKVTLRQIKKVYPPDVTVFDGLDLEIRDGEFLVLVGPSGCGKTTILRLISGLIRPEAGEVLFDGTSVTKLEPHQRNVAMVFQNYALYAHLTVYKNIAFPLTVKKLKREEVDKRVREAAELLDITFLLNRRPRALSGGQRQRVALGRAMVREPSVFLLDEPLSNLDVSMRQDLRRKIIEIHRRLRTTFVYVTHDQNEAMAMGDRIAVMKEGQILQLDTPQQIYDHPADTFVAEFMGSPKMNLLTGTLRRSGDAFMLDLENGGFALPAACASRQTFTAYAGRTVIFGIRPEDIHEPGFAQPGCQPFDAVLTDVEHMGAGAYCTFDCGGEKLTATLPNRTRLQAGERLRLMADCAGVQLFDAESGINLFRM